MLYGSTQLNMRSGLQTDGPEFRTLWLDYACEDNGGWYYTMPECISFYDGVMTKGLFGAFSSYAGIGRDLIQWRRNAIADLSQPVPRVNIETPGTNRDIMSQFGTMYLAEAFARNSLMKKTRSIQLLESFLSLYGLLVGVTIAALVIFWFFVYRPMVVRLDKDIKDVRLLLLLFPDEVASSVPAIVSIGKELLSDWKSGKAKQR